jgi:transposase
MEHVGIDLGSKESQVCIVTAQGTRRAATRCATKSLPKLFASLGPSRVVMETCSESAAASSLARAAGHEVAVVPSSIVRTLGVGARGIKTDERDAEVLAMASYRLPELPSVHVKRLDARDRLRMLGMRRRLVHARKLLVNGVKSYLRTLLLRVSSKADGLFTRKVREELTGASAGVPEDIELTLQMIERVTESIRTLDSSLEEAASQDVVAHQLMTVPGIGPITALTFQSTIDDPTRFESSAQVASYLGLVPGQDTTGFKIKRTGTIRAAPLELKALLVQCAWSMWRARPNDPLSLWARDIAERRGKRIAIVALARKLATIAWSMWRHGTKYDPSRGSTRRQQPAHSPTSTPLADVALAAVSSRPAAEPRPTDPPAPSAASSFARRAGVERRRAEAKP